MKKTFFLLLLASIVPYTHGGLGLFLRVQRDALNGHIQEYMEKNKERFKDVATRWGLGDEHAYRALTPADIYWYIKDVFQTVYGASSARIFSQAITDARSSKPTQRLERGVILIHGSGVQDWQWAPAKTYFAEKDFHDVRTVNYDSSQPVMDSCRTVWQQIREQCTDDAEIVLIGHSQGGLIARAFIDHPEFVTHKEGPKIKGVFQLHAPINGVPLINYMMDTYGKDSCPQVMQDMAVESEFLEALHSRMTRKKSEQDPQIYEFVGEQDAFVSPASGISHHDVLQRKDCGHFAIAADSHTWHDMIIPAVQRILDGSLNSN